MCLLGFFLLCIVVIFIERFWEIGLVSYVEINRFLFMIICIIVFDFGFK